MDDRLAGVEVERRPGDRQRVDVLGTTRGIDRGQPAGLAVADQVHGIADVIDCTLDHIEVVVDRRVLRACGGADPVKGVRALEPSRSNRAHLALRRRVVHDARVVPGLRREHERREHSAAASSREVPKPGDRRLEYQFVGRAPAGRQHPRPAQTADRPSQFDLDRLRPRRILEGRGAPPGLSSASARAPEEEESV
jgi:hypothetical protein